MCNARFCIANMQVAEGCVWLVKLKQGRSCCLRPYIILLGKCCTGLWPNTEPHRTSAHIVNVPIKTGTKLRMSAGH